MPSPSTNSSSALTQEAQDEYISYRNSDEFTNNTQAIAENTNDLHYSTEELLDALPRIWTRGVFYTLIGFALLAIPWATFSKVDETGTARGRIEPQGATQKLDSQASGSVKLVKVKEGDAVKAGQVLLELESDVLQTQFQQTEAKLSGLLNQKGQLYVLKNQLQLTLSSFGKTLSSEPSETKPRCQTKYS
jgi:hemolysin D